MNMIKNLLIGIIASLLVGILIYLYESKISNDKEFQASLIEKLRQQRKNNAQNLQNFEVLSKKYNNLENGFIDKKEIFTKDYKKRQLSLLTKYELYLKNLPPVKVYIEASSDKRLLFSNYIDLKKVSKSSVFRSLSDVCKYNFYGLYYGHDSDFYKLPQKVKAPFAELFSMTQQDCVHITAGINSIEKNSFLLEVGYSLADIIPYGENAILSQYDRVLDQAQNVNRAIRQERKIILEY